MSTIFSFFGNLFYGTPNVDNQNQEENKIIARLQMIKLKGVTKIKKMQKKKNIRKRKRK